MKVRARPHQVPGGWLQLTLRGRAAAGYCADHADAPHAAAAEADQCWRRYLLERTLVLGTSRGDAGHPPPEGGGYGGFSWLCPGCGSWHYGQLAGQPVSGWDAPRWVNSGTREAPTLTPSLGCGGWKHGTCPEGHYWLRDGMLVPA